MKEPTVMPKLNTTLPVDASAENNADLAEWLVALTDATAGTLKHTKASREAKKPHGEDDAEDQVKGNDHGSTKR